jgi:hypothetical protein
MSGVLHPYEAHLREVFEKHRGEKWVYSADQVSAATQSKPNALSPVFARLLHDGVHGDAFQFDKTIFALATSFCGFVFEANEMHGVNVHICTAGVIIGFRLRTIEVSAFKGITCDITTMDGTVSLDGERIGNLGNFTVPKRDHFKRVSQAISRAISAADHEIRQRVVADEREQREAEAKRLASAVSKQADIQRQFDADGNGVLDLVEAEDDFKNLVRHHQKSITELDPVFVQQFVKIATYHKTKRGNLQDLFSTMGTEDAGRRLMALADALENGIHAYNITSARSIQMVVSLVEGDLMTFYEIYEAFDKLHIFNSQWETEVARELSTVNANLDSVVGKMTEVEATIIHGFAHLSAISVEATAIVATQLDHINSKLGYQNLVHTVNTVRSLTK